MSDKLARKFLENINPSLKNQDLKNINTFGGEFLLCCIDKALNQEKTTILRKYMQHILEEEGVTFMKTVNNGQSKIKFTMEDIEVLNKIQENINEKV